MDSSAKLGTKVRQLRRKEGFTQVQLAEKLGISPSYLNLIEYNRRLLTGPLLIKLAQMFQLDLHTFASEPGALLVPDLNEVFLDPLFESHEIGAAEVRDLANTSPALARAVIVLYEAYRSRPPRPAASGEVLDDGDGAVVEWARLSSEEVSDLLQRRMNHFPELEEAAEALIRDADLVNSDTGSGLVAHLRHRFGIEVKVTDLSQSSGATRRFEPDRKLLTLSEVLPPRSRNFQLAHQVALLTHQDILHRITRDEGLTSEGSRALCRVALANYFAAAVLMPYSPFLQAARTVRYDVEILGHRFRTSFEQVCQRLTTLQRPGAQGIPFHFVRVDIAGNISKRFSASGIRFARFSGACPRWNVHSAFLTPGMIRAQLSRMNDQTPYFCFSRTVGKGSGGYHSPHAVHAIGMGCAVEHAREMVYSDGVDLSNLEAAVPIGVSCRLCDRMDCEQRAFPPQQHPLRIDENVRGVSFYAPAPGGSAKLLKTQNN